MKIRWDDFDIEQPEIARPANCTCRYQVDLLLGLDRYIVTTDPKCAVHGWDRQDEDSEWQPTE